MKSICALVHRDDLDRQTFQNHYETFHAPLAVQYFPFRRYVRNHFIDGEDIGYDTISEFWADDILASAELMRGPVGVLMRADEERFMNRALTAPASAVEHILSAGAPTREDGRRVAALIDWTLPDDEGRALAMAWATQCAALMEGVSVDFADSWREPPFPSRAVLWMPQRCEVAPDSNLRVRLVNCRRVETPAHELCLAR